MPLMLVYNKQKGYGAKVLEYSDAFGAAPLSQINLLQTNFILITG